MQHVSVDCGFLYSPKITAAGDLPRLKDPAALPKRPRLLSKGEATGVRGDRKQTPTSNHDAAITKLTMPAGTRRGGRMGNAACGCGATAAGDCEWIQARGHHGDINHTWQPGDSRLDNGLNA